MKLSGHEQGVMMTSNDALVTKVMAAQLGYFNDEYSKLFLKNKKKMYPIINRGTWSRVQAYRQTITKFLTAFKDAPNVNILSLGGGYDTTFFWLLQQDPSLSTRLCYVEVDYDSVVNKKIEVINKNANIKEMILNDSAESSPYEINADNYKLFACNVCDTQSLSAKLQEFKVAGNVPTLVLTECLLIYLEP